MNENFDDTNFEMPSLANAAPTAAPTAAPAYGTPVQQVTPVTPEPVQQPAFEMPAVEPVQTPAYETPVHHEGLVNATGFEMPAVEQTPQPVVQPQPVPPVQEAPVVAAPVQEEQVVVAPVVEAPAAPAEQIVVAPVAEAPAAPAEQATIDSTVLNNQVNETAVSTPTSATNKEGKKTKEIIGTVVVLVITLAIVFVICRNYFMLG